MIIMMIILMLVVIARPCRAADGNGVDENDDVNCDSDGFWQRRAHSGADVDHSTPAFSFTETQEFQRVGLFTCKTEGPSWA